MQTLTTISGKLLFTPKSAELTHDTELFAKMDPYLIVKCGYETKKSRVHENGGKRPKWNEVNTPKMTNGVDLDLRDQWTKRPRGDSNG